MRYGKDDITVSYKIKIPPGNVLVTRLCSQLLYIRFAADVPEWRKGKGKK